ncbi:MAG: LysM peptidoglycan-binding domain-containing protein [Bacteriovoracaceae bacterium]|nr:LysM peptidoglycan-binding domain-containing protein [Bacteriovoracaceae bacterium]
MKLSLLLSIILLSGCAQLKRRSIASSDSKKLMDTTEIEWSALEKMDEEGENTHALVDTDASDSEIAKAQGGSPDDTEAVEESKSSRPFLKQVRTKRVKFWVDYFTVKQRDRFQRFLDNASMYKPIVEKILENEGVPKELFYVGLIESGYYLGAHSRAKAVGPWQFIRGTAKRYNLTMNNDIDERRDIFKATQAAAQYFRDLHNIFSSWELALAAYNSGEYGVIRRITKYKTRDYYELSHKQQLPSETINYVPKVIAAMYVVNNAEKYGFRLNSAAAQFWQKTKMIDAPKGKSLSYLSKRVGISSTLLAKLNPELRAGKTPRSFPGTYQIRIPADKHTEWMETYVADAPTESSRVKEVEVLREKILNPPPYVAPVAMVKKKIKIHRTRRGDTLSSIAAHHNMSLRDLAQMNGLTTRSRIKIGQKIRLEKSSRKIASTSATKSKKVAKVKPIVYRLKSGETLTDVATWFNTSVTALKRENHINRGRNLHVGHKIRIPETKRGTYTVKRGDYLLKIAEKFNLNQTALMKLNDLKRARLFPGQRLVVNLE